MAAGATYTPIATTTLGATASSYTFSSIPSTYSDLVLIATINGFASQTECGLRFNGDSGSNYSRTYLVGDGSVAFSGRSSNATNITISANTTSLEMFTVSIMNYSNATTYKSVVSRSDSAPTAVKTTTGLWRNTAAINSLSIVRTGAVDLPAGSTFTLYGIAAA